MFDFVIHNLLGSAIAIATFIGLEYISDSDNFYANLNTYKNNIIYWCGDKVVSLYTLYKEYSKKHKKKSTILAFNYTNDGTLDEVSTDNVFKKVLVDNKEYFVDCDINYDKDEYSVFKPFISISLHLGDEEYDISEHLEKFYIVGNQLDYAFMRAFTKKFYNINIDNSYTLKGFDTECNLFDISHKKTIIIKEDSYELFNEDATDSEDSDESSELNESSEPNDVDIRNRNCEEDVTNV